jgi:hypothetical protein
VTHSPCSPTRLFVGAGLKTCQLRHSACSFRKRCGPDAENHPWLVLAMNKLQFSLRAAAHRCITTLSIQKSRQLEKTLFLLSRLRTTISSTVNSSVITLKSYYSEAFRSLGVELSEKAYPASVSSPSKQCSLRPGDWFANLRSRYGIEYTAMAMQTSNELLNMLPNGSSHSPHLLDSSSQRAQHRGMTPQDYLETVREQFERTLAVMEVGCSFLPKKCRRGASARRGEKLTARVEFIPAR